MSYSVICPSCHERNVGSALHCVKCNTSLIGVPRQEDLFSKPKTAFQPETTTNRQTALSENNKHSIIESILRALWRHLRTALVTFILTSLFTALICWLLNRRTLYDFGNTLFYAGAFLAFIGWANFRAHQRFFQSQANLLNPMSKAMPGTHLERTRQLWLDYRQGATSTSVIVASIVLCWGLGWLLITLVE